MSPTRSRRNPSPVFSIGHLVFAEARTQVVVTDNRTNCRSGSFLPEPFQHLRHPGATNAKIAGKRGPALELAGVEQRLVVLGPLERIAAFLRSGFRFEFGVEGGIPGEYVDNRRST
jgi:hypothetical protein